MKRLKPNWRLVGVWTAAATAQVFAAWPSFGLWTIALVVAGLGLGIVITIRTWRREDELKRLNQRGDDNNGNGERLRDGTE